MERRYHTVKGKWGLFVLFLLLGLICNPRFALTPLIRMDLYPIPLMIVAYLGYKFGRKAGLVAGLICSWFWTIVLLFSGLDWSWSQLLLNGVNLNAGALRLVGHSLQHGIIVAFLGWGCGYLFDHLDEVLRQNGSSISYLIPPRPRRSILIRSFRLFENRDVNQPGEDKPVRLESELRKRILKKTAVLPLALFLALVNIQLVFRDAFVSIDILPDHVVTVAVLIWAFNRGSAAGIRLAVSMWVLSIILSFQIGPVLFDLARDLRMNYSIGTPAQAVGLTILAWWAGQIGTIYRDADRLKTLSILWPPLRRSQVSEADPGYGWLIISLICLINLSIGMRAAGFGVDQMFFSLHAFILLIALLAIWSRHHHAVAISNRSVPVFLVLAFCQAHHDIADHIRLFTADIDMLDVLVLCLIPLVIGTFEIKERSQWRIFSFGILALLVIPDVYVRGEHIPLFKVFELSFDRQRPVLLTWGLTIGAFELMARVLHYTGNHLNGAAEDS